MYVAEKFKVTIADGARLECAGACRRIPFSIQGHTFTNDFYLLDLEGCDVILGTKWLRRLKPIILDFSAWWMRFWYGDQQVELHSS